ncbi:Rieske 2Fe-2S domain-containing protein [Roseivirga sp. E12]|uniref:Rieske (2Fe-2S) protein n=1 Tax=Roseivirga sp. E12 TaxID=2819237 RepID=UPI001ABC02A8|nr:Rieske 2Fe-2S domain-containing protein [Roseivirga sp. E12]MBO3697188.1 Rieske 2Fe-2S domain-containing protein [Roseivirga sp. E12]
MKRKDFLKKLGGGAAFALTATCLGGCAVENINPDQPGTSTAIDFTLDLNAAVNSNLSNNGGYVIVNNQVVVARATTGEYVAATRTCSHDPRKEVILRNGEWYCTAHGARFRLDGAGLNGNGRNGLTIYNTELNGNMLRVFA